MMKFGILMFFGNLSRKLEFFLNMTGNLHEDLCTCTFMVVSCLILLGILTS
jgi:hypothetical protein